MSCSRRARFSLSRTLFLVAVLLSGPLHLSAQGQGKPPGQGQGSPGSPTIQTVQPPGGGTGDTSPPSIAFTPASGTFYSAAQTVRIDWCDNVSLYTASRQVKLNGTVVSSGWTSVSKPGCGVAMYSNVTVNLAMGANTLWARVCDNANNCREQSAAYTLSVGDQSAPAATFAPAGSTTSNAVPGRIEIRWCDNSTLNTATQRVFFNGTDVTGQFSANWPSATTGCGAYSVVSGGSSLRLQPGANTLTAEITDNAGNRGIATATYVYQPAVSTAPNNQSIHTPGMFDAALTYSMPAYMTLDQPRAITLVYSSSQAAPVGRVELDVTDESADPAPTTGIRLLRNNAVQPLAYGQPEMVYATGAGTSRVSAWFDARSLPTGAYTFTAVLTRYWPNRAQEQVSVPVRVLIVNEMTSALAPGWSLLGVPRAHLTEGGVLITEGDGSATFFPSYGTCTQSSASCSFQRPQGDFSSLEYSSTGGYTRRYPDGTVTTFTTTGLPLSIRDRFNNATTFEYYGNVHLAAIVDPTGKRLQLGYNGARVTSLQDPVGRVTNLYYDAAGGLSAVDDAGGAALRAVYDGAHRLIWWTGRGGNPWNAAYDAWGRLASITPPPFTAEGGQTFHLSTTFVSHDRAVLPAPGRGTATAPADRVVPSAVRALVTDPRGNTTRYALDAWGEPTLVQDARGYTSTYARNADGQLTSERPANGTAYTYQWSGVNMTQKTGPTGTVNMSYGLYEQLTAAWGATPNVVNHYGDDAVLDSTTVAGHGTTRYTFDARGRIRTVVDPEGHLTERVYDAAGWQNTVSVGTGTAATGATRVTSYTYDGVGRLYTATDPEQKRTTVHYDGLNRQWQVIRPDQGVVEYTWGPLFLDAVKDPEGQVHRWTRNALGWVTQEVRPGDTAGVHLATEYDRYGRVTATVNRRGQRVSFGYDAYDRVVWRTADGATTTYAYSADAPSTPSAPSWVAASNGESTDTLHFDGRGRLTDAITLRPTTAGPRRYAVTSQYDAYSRRSQLLLGVPGGGQYTTLWNYDAATFRLSGIVDPQGGSTRFGYDAEGMRTRDTLPGGQVVARTYASSHQPASIRYGGAAALDEAAGLVFEYDGLDRVRRRRNAHNTRRRDYLYDGPRMWWFGDFALTGTTKPTCTSDPNYGVVCNDPSTIWNQYDGETFTYDLEDNPTDRGAVEGAGYRLRAFTGFGPGGWTAYTLGYDLDGNLTSKNAAGFTQTLSWNSLGQLASVTTNGQTVHYGYDGFGRRVRASYPDGRVARQVYDGDHLLAELDAAGTVVAGWTYYPGADQPHTMVRNGQSYYYAIDPQGSVLALFNSAGQVVNRYAYRPFGETESATEGVVNPLRYAGREMEGASGLYYYRNRWYDPSLHRFISEDPIGVQGGLNLYAYVGNDPVNHTDPSGLKMQASDHCIWANGRYWCTTVLDPVVVVADPVRDPATIGRFTPRGPNHHAEGWMAHHRQFGTPTLARSAHRQLLKLSPYESQRVQCLVNGWMVPDAQGVLAPLNIMLGDLSAYGATGALAIALRPNTIVLSGGQFGALSLGDRALAYTIGHEVGHFVQYATMGNDAYDELWNSPGGENFLQADANAYADAHVKMGGPACR